MLTPEHIFQRAVANHAKVGIGLGEDSRKVLRSVRDAERNGYARTVTFDSAADMVAALRNGEVDAVVRGDLSANLAMAEVKSQFSLDHLLRAALMQPKGGRMFFLAPVGVDEGWSVEQKLEFVRYSAPLFRQLGIPMRAGALSGGRMGDIGRSVEVDRSIREAMEVERRGREEGFDVEHCQILIEEAVRVKNLVIAPDGITGNLIFRTMHLVDGCVSMGAPILNLDRVFIDTSRAKRCYADSIALASALANRGK
ncbi:MAG TPA: methanogenesis marker protein Mmp4/MtxX [Methanomassiliicoccales archaeon]|nr:methanogenesis marker protein Mmp4/MtxX [Methanomassiliicoccales archaeon]